MKKEIIAALIVVFGVSCHNSSTNSSSVETKPVDAEKKMEPFLEQEIDSINLILDSVIAIYDSAIILMEAGEDAQLFKEKNKARLKALGINYSRKLDGVKAYFEEQILSPEKYEEFMSRLKFEEIKRKDALIREMMVGPDTIQ